jgi:hypothetical protein
MAKMILGNNVVVLCRCCDCAFGLATTKVRQRQAAWLHSSGGSGGGSVATAAWQRQR